MVGWDGGNIYISVTFEPEHLIPFHESSQGSPPLDLQPSSWEGEFMLRYMTLRAETGKTINLEISKSRKKKIT